MNEHLRRPNRHCGSRRLLAISPHPDHYRPLDSLFIWGANDPAVGRCGAEDTADFVAKGKYTFEVLQDSGHWILESDSDFISEKIISNIKSVD